MAHDGHSMKGGIRVKTIPRLIPVLAIVAMLAIASPAFAGKGGGKHGGGRLGTGGLELKMVNDVNGNTLPNWGDSIRFNVNNTATTEPHVDVACKQDGVVVYGATTGYYASYPWPWTQVMTLSSGMWTGGAANCTATLSAYSGTNVTKLGVLPFTVNA